jgi:hypothetical protein
MSNKKNEKSLTVAQKKTLINSLRNDAVEMHKKANAIGDAADLMESNWGLAEDSDDAEEESDHGITLTESQTLELKIKKKRMSVPAMLHMIRQEGFPNPFHVAGVLQAIAVHYPDRHMERRAAIRMLREMVIKGFIVEMFKDGDNTTYSPWGVNQKPLGKSLSLGVSSSHTPAKDPEDEDVIKEGVDYHKMESHTR